MNQDCCHTALVADGGVGAITHALLPHCSSSGRGEVGAITHALLPHCSSSGRGGVPNHSQ